MFPPLSANLGETFVGEALLNKGLHGPVKNHVCRYWYKCYVEKCGSCGALTFCLLSCILTTYSQNNTMIRPRGREAAGSTQGHRSGRGRGRGTPLPTRRGTWGRRRERGRGCEPCGPAGSPPRTRPRDGRGPAAKLDGARKPRSREGRAIAATDEVANWPRGLPLWTTPRGPSVSPSRARPGEGRGR